MKLVKHASQKNAEVNRAAYIDGILPVEIFHDRPLRVYLNHVHDLKVTVDPYGYYTTVAVMDSGETAYINL